MKISQIYEKYKIMPQLQLHMLRVAGVAFLICDNVKKPINKNIIISVCLIHDIGNVVKFNFNSKKFTESWFYPNGKKYWKKVQTDFIKRYSDTDYVANYKIAKELNFPSNGLKIIKLLKFKNMQKIFRSKDFKLKICEYADLRVKPKGVCSIKDRLDEAFIRYQPTKIGIIVSTNSIFILVMFTKSKNKFSLIAKLNPVILPKKRLSR